MNCLKRKNNLNTHKLERWLQRILKGFFSDARLKGWKFEEEWMRTEAGTCTGTKVWQAHSLLFGHLALQARLSSVTLRLRSLTLDWERSTRLFLHG